MGQRVLTPLAISTPQLRLLERRSSTLCKRERNNPTPNRSSPILAYHVRHLNQTLAPNQISPPCDTDSSYYAFGSHVSKGSNTCICGLCVLLGDLHSRNVLDGGVEPGRRVRLLGGRGKGFHAYAIGIAWL